VWAITSSAWPITTSYLLAKQGKSVIMLDDGAVGGGKRRRQAKIIDGWLLIERHSLSMNCEAASSFCYIQSSQLLFSIHYSPPPVAFGSELNVAILAPLLSAILDV
jgi:hypothetical protein